MCLFAFWERWGNQNTQKCFENLKEKWTEKEGKPKEIWSKNVENGKIGDHQKWTD